MLSSNLEHRIAAADRLRSSRELSKYKARCFSLVPRAASALLDLGSATGEDALALAECLGAKCQVIGVELDADLVAEARRRSRNVALDVHFVVGDCRSLPFASAKFDVVRADHVLGSLPDRQLALAQCARVLSAGGLLIVHDDDPTLQSDLYHSGLTLLASFDLPYEGRGTATWLLCKSNASPNARV